MLNLLKSDLYRLVHGKMLWVGLACLALVVVGAAGLIWFATTPEFAQMVNEQAQEARQSGATVTLTSPNGADLDAEEVQALNEKVIGSRTYSYGNTFMVGFLGLIVAVLAALLASSDFDTGFAKNVLAGRGDRRAYFAEKLVLIAALCGVFLLAGMLLSDAVYAVLGFSYRYTETVGEYWSWAGLTWLVLTAYAFLGALIAWATRSKTVGVVLAALVPTGFLESMVLGAAAVLAPAVPLVGDMMQWLPTPVQQRMAVGGAGLFETGGSAVAGLPPAAQVLIVFGAIVIVCAALSLTACRKRDV